MSNPADVELMLRGATAAFRKNIEDRILQELRDSIEPKLVRLASETAKQIEHAVYVWHNQRDFKVEMEQRIVVQRKEA